MLITKKLRGRKETVALLSLSISSKPEPEPELLLGTTTTTTTSVAVEQAAPVVDVAVIVAE